MSAGRMYAGLINFAKTPVVAISALICVPVEWPKQKMELVLVSRSVNVLYDDGKHRDNDEFFLFKTIILETSPVVKTGTY